MLLDMEQIINIENERWVIRLTNDNQLSFAYILPYEKTQACTDPLWHDWDDGPYIEERVVFMQGVSSISPFKLRRHLITEISKFINRNKITFFYFQPTTQQRGRIYNSLVSTLISTLGGDWDFQISNEEWFYFYKNKI
jgi:hypothetical protein